MAAKIIITLTVFLITICLDITAHAAPKKKKGLTDDAILRGYSIDQIEQVSNYLLARVEADPLPKGAKILTCDAPIDKVNTWLSGPVHALVDEKRAAVVGDYKKAPATFADKIRGCAERCTCNAYQLLFEDVNEDLKTNPDHAKNQAAMKVEMRKVGKGQSLKCAKAMTWYCGSDFDKFLRAQ